MVKSAKLKCINEFRKEYIKCMLLFSACLMKRVTWVPRLVQTGRGGK